MPKLATYTVIQDAPFPLPGEPLPVNDRHFRNIAAPNVDTGSPAILAFRVNPDGKVTLQMRLNNTVVLRQTFDTDPERVWHEVFSAGDLRAADNELTVSIGSNDPGKVTVADIVLFFQVNVP
jgi:hypothetical protein